MKLEHLPWGHLAPHNPPTPDPTPFCASFPSTKILAIATPHLLGPVPSRMLSGSCIPPKITNSLSWPTVREPVSSIPMDKYMWGRSGGECPVILSSMGHLHFEGSPTETFGNSSHCSRLTRKAYVANCCVPALRGSLRSQEGAALHSEYLAASLSPSYVWRFNHQLIGWISPIFSWLPCLICFFLNLKKKKTKQSHLCGYLYIVTPCPWSLLTWQPDYWEDGHSPNIYGF